MSSIDSVSDSLSLATISTGAIGEIGVTKQYAFIPFDCSSIHGRALSRTTLFDNDCRKATEKDLYDFLKEAQLEHYYSVLTIHLKVRSVQQIKYVEDCDLVELGFSRPEQRRLRKYFKKECPQTTMGKLRKRWTRSTSDRCFSPSATRDKLDCVSIKSSMLSVSQQKKSSSSKESMSPLHMALWNKSSLSVKDLSDGSPYRHALNNGIHCNMIPADELQIGSNLGEGQFGKVFQGVWHKDRSPGCMMQVAIKVFEGEAFLKESKVLYDELSIMCQLEHPNIVQMHGVCIQGESVKLITELAPLRSLLECLREAGLRNNFTVPILYQFAYQIARGMGYLEDCQLVHQCLAARNVLVFSKEIVKISDFGVSRALQLGKSYYQSNFNMNLCLPTAWCAPETMHDLIFTSSSDIWAYAVTLWEMFTYGFTPWAGLSGSQIMQMIDAPLFTRLKQPDACPDTIYDAIMRACWAHEPKARPSFSQLLDIMPRLSPEIWITTSEHNSTCPDLIDDDNSSMVSNASTTPDLTRHSIGRSLNVRANEIVSVLGKRSLTAWKVISLSTGLIGFLPPTILKPYLSTDASRKLSTTPKSVTSPNTKSSSTAGSTSNSIFGLSTKTRFRLSRRENNSFKVKSTRSPSQPSINGRDSIIANQISPPQNDFRHISHVGADGHTFGDLGIIGKAITTENNLNAGQSLENLDEYNEDFVDKVDSLPKSLDLGSSLFDAVFECFQPELFNIDKCNVSIQNNENSNEGNSNPPHSPQQNENPTSIDYSTPYGTENGSATLRLPATAIDHGSVDGHMEPQISFPVNGDDKSCDSAHSVSTLSRFSLRRKRSNSRSIETTTTATINDGNSSSGITGTTTVSTLRKLSSLWSRGSMDRCSRRSSSASRRSKGHCSDQGDTLDGRQPPIIISGPTLIQSKVNPVRSSPTSSVLDKSLNCVDGSPNDDNYLTGNTTSTPIVHSPAQVSVVLNNFNGIKLSNDKSLSSQSSVLRAPSLSSIASAPTTITALGSKYNMTATRISTAQGIRALRTKDTVFRAPSACTSSSQRRKISAHCQPGVLYNQQSNLSTASLDSPQPHGTIPANDESCSGTLKVRKDYLLDAKVNSNAKYSSHYCSTASGIYKPSTESSNATLSLHNKTFGRFGRNGNHSGWETRQNSSELMNNIQHRLPPN